MKSLFELRKEAQALGIEDYASMSKETLAQVIEKANAGEAGSTIAEIEPEEELTSEEQAAVDAAEEELEAEKKLTPVEKLAARNAKKAQDKIEKEERAKNKEISKKAEKEEALRLKKEAKEKEAADKIAAKEAKKAAKEAAKIAKVKTPKAPKEKSTTPASGVLNFVPKTEKPEFRPGMSGLIYEELLKNDGRPYGQIAREINSHYNMVRRIAELYFDITSSTPAVEPPVQETETVDQETSEETASAE